MQAERLTPLIGSRYQLVEALGRGGMGTVYRAFDRLTRSEVALKRVTIPTEALQFASRISSGSSVTGSSNLRIALAQEFHTLASLRHPNIIRVLDYGFDAEHMPYLTMDLLDEPQSLTAAGRDLPLRDKIDLLVQMLQAVAYLHRRNIVHRDLKPDNVIVVDDNGARRVRVLDFGLALSPDYIQNEARGLAGTMVYIAPEVLQGDNASISSDLYAVGVIAYELLTGRHPFSAPKLTELINNVLKSDPDLVPLDRIQPPLDKAALADEYTPLLAEIIARLLAKHPLDRYRDADAVIADLCAAVGIPVPEESAAIRESFLQAARFVGRDAEKRTLYAALTATRQGEGSLWLVGGESGVGKSRLLAELRTRGLTSGILTLRGQAVASGALPYQMWHDPLRRLVLSTPLSREELSILATILPDIHALFDDVPFFDGIDPQQRLIRTIIDSLRRQTEPVLLLLEDLQWANESLEILKRLAPYVRDLPLMIVGSYRDDERPSLPADLPQAQVLSLPRLSPDEIAELTVSMLGSAGMQPNVVEFLQRETEGNAFFLVETVRALAEESGGMSAIGRDTLPERLMTGGVQQVIYRRLNRVPPEARDLLKAAAVIGRDLDLNLLAAINNDALNLDDWLTTCANRAIFEAHEGSWRFAHDKLREALLDELTPDERVALHRAAAEAVETIYAEGVERYAAALAQHWHGAGDERKEACYTIVAAHQARQNNAYRDASRLYRRALDLQAYQYEDDPRTTEADLHHELGNVFYQMGEYAEAREQQRISLDLYRALDNQLGIANAINALGESDFRQGLFAEGQVKIEEALAIREALGARRDIGYSYMNLGVIEAQQDRWERGEDLARKSVEILREDGLPRDLARALNNLAIMIDQRGDKEGAKVIHAEALAIRRSDDDLMGICYSLCNIGALEIDLGNLDESKELLEESLQISRQLADRLATATIYSMFGNLYEKWHDYDTARDNHSQALHLHREIENRSGIVIAIRALGNIALAQQDYDAALIYLREAVILGTDWAMPSQVAETLQSIVRLLAAHERWRQAVKLLAFVKTQRADSEPRDDELLAELEAQMTENAFASALALGETLTMDKVFYEVDQGTLEF